MILLRYEKYNNVVIFLEILYRTYLKSMKTFLLAIIFQDGSSFKRYPIILQMHNFQVDNIILQIDRGRYEVLLLNIENFSIQWAGTLNVSQSNAMIGDNIGRLAAT